MSRRDWDADRGPNPEGTEDCRGGWVSLMCVFTVVKGLCVSHSLQEDWIAQASLARSVGS